MWLPVPTDLTLLPNDVHVWRINLDVPEAQLPNLLATLASDEVHRANRFYFPEHRQRFIAGRGILRRILGRYLGIEPQQVQFDYQSRGKPVLAASLTDSGISFNLSHSQGLALCAVTSGRFIGADLECIRPMSDIEALAKRFFLPREYEVVRSLTGDEQQKIFFRYWTCKEAYLKATGDGISQLEQIEVVLNPTTPAKLQTLENWSLFELVPADNYLGAVAVASMDCSLKYWQCSDLLSS